MIVIYVLLCLSICALTFTVFRIKRCRFNRLMEKLPGPERYTILGNIPDLMCDDERFFKKLREWSTKYGPVYNISCMYLPTVNICDPEEFELIASSTKNMKKSIIYGMLIRWLGRGLLTSSGSKWKTHRKIVSSAFNFSILQNFVPIFHQETKKLLNILKNYQGKEVNVVPLSAQFALYCVAETAMGVSLDSKNDNDIEYINSLFKIGKIFYHRMVRPWLYNNTIFYNISSTGKLEKKLLKIIHSFNDKIVKERSEKYVKVKSTDIVSDFDRKKLTVVDLLLEAKYSDGKINDKGIQDEVSTLMFAGQDTSSICLTFTLLLLAHHKNIQDQVYQEISYLFGDTHRYLTFNELNDLKYMEMVIKESLRLYPSAPFIGRVLEEDLMTKEGYLLPKGVIVNIHIYDIHRNAKHWPEPDKFDPERFLPENCVNRHPCAFVPFSAGPRNCIGQKFAFLELKAVLYGILKNFVILPVDTPDTVILVPDMVLRSKEEKVMLKFLPRK